jgi:predicted nucleic acid-binding protein
VSFLVDTDICSAHLKNVRIVTNRFLQYTGRLKISVITLGELYTWALRAKASPKRLQSLLELLNDVTVLTVDLTLRNLAVLAEERCDQAEARLWRMGLDTCPGDPEAMSRGEASR